MPTISFDVPVIKISAFETINGREKWRTHTAIDLKAKSKIGWQQKAEDPLMGVVLATAGGLMFTGEDKCDLSPFDARMGERLWCFRHGGVVVVFGLGNERPMACDQKNTVRPDRDGLENGK